MDAGSEIDWSVLENQSADIEAAENFSVFAKPVVSQKGELEGFIYRLQKGWKAQAQHYLMMFLFIVHLTKSVMMLPLNPQPFRKRWNMLKPPANDIFTLPLRNQLLSFFSLGYWVILGYLRAMIYHRIHAKVSWAHMTHSSGRLNVVKWYIYMHILSWPTQWYHKSLVLGSKISYSFLLGRAWDDDFPNLPSGYD